MKATAFRPTVSTLLHEFRTSEQLVGLFGRDDFRGQVMLRRLPPWGSGDFTCRPIVDGDITRCAAWFEKARGAAPRSSLLREVIEVVAEEASYDSLGDHLRSLVWDGTERLDTWVVKYLGTDDNEYTRGVGKAFLLGAAARGLTPGVKFDNVLVLEGAQDCGKSTIVRLLSGGFGGDELGDLRNKDSRIGLRGRWIIELAELDDFERNKPNALKRFFTSREDSYRPPYGRFTVTVPRRSVFIGTTNNERYLVDPTGNRRYWPLRVGLPDLAALARDRDQLIAEAVAKTKDAAWVLPDALRTAAESEQASRMLMDDFERRVRKFAEELEDTSTEKVRAALGSTSEMSRRSEETRIGVILRTLGFRRQQSTGGKHVYRRQKLGASLTPQKEPATSAA